MSPSAVPYAQTPVTAEQEAFLHLQSAIRLGRYRAGDRLIPEEIAAEIGMSRMPVREAFQRLAVEGLVVIRPNRGCIVAGLTLDEIYETFEIRSVLEGLAVRLAMPGSTAKPSPNSSACWPAWSGAALPAAPTG